MTSLSDLRDMSNDQMIAVMNEATKDLFHLRVQASTERLETPTEMARIRKLIARGKTILREREIAAQNESSKSLEQA